MSEMENKRENIDEIMRIFDEIYPPQPSQEILSAPHTDESFDDTFEAIRKFFEENPNAKGTPSLSYEDYQIELPKTKKVQPGSTQTSLQRFINSPEFKKLVKEVNGELNEDDIPLR